VSFGQFKGRIIPAYVVIIMLFFAVAPVFLMHGTVHAVDGQVSSRSIQMDDSTTTSVTGPGKYLVTFTPLMLAPQPFTALSLIFVAPTQFREMPVPLQLVLA